MKFLQTNRLSILVLFICMGANISICEEVAIEDLMKKVQDGDAEAMTALGELYLSGDGVEQNIREALSLFGQAADLGNGNAQYNLGYMYSQGRGVSQNPIEAISLLEKASNNGIVEAQVELGLMYINGEVISLDYVKAEKYFKLASEQGEASAQNNLGWIYLEGLGVEKDFQQAERWFTMAAEQGLMLAQANLGSMFSDEASILDRVKGHMWLSIAAANGNESTGKKAYIMEVMMSRDDIAEAKRLADEWLEKHQTEE